MKYTVAIFKEDKKLGENLYTFNHDDLGLAIEQALLYTISQKDVVNLIDNRTGELIFSYNDISNCTVSITFSEYVARRIGDA